MHKKRLIRFAKYFIGFSAAILFLYFVLGFQMPAMKKRVFIFGLWFFAEIYLWIGFFRTFDFFPKKEKSSRRKKIKEIVFIVLYWLPAVVVAVSLLFLTGKGIQGVNKPVYSMVLGICVIQYLIKFLLFLLLVVFDVFVYFARRFRKTPFAPLPLVS